jgi:hypothetical protein
MVQNTSETYVFPCAEEWPCTGNPVCYYCQEKRSQESLALETVEEPPATEEESSTDQTDKKLQYERIIEAQRIQLDGWHLVDREEIEEEMEGNGK